MISIEFIDYYQPEYIRYDIIYDGEEVSENKKDENPNINQR